MFVLTVSLIWPQRDSDKIGLLQYESSRLEDISRGKLAK